MRLPDTAIRRPVFAVMLIGGLVVLGTISAGRLGLDLFPRVEFPLVTVTTVLQGAAPQTVEREVTQVLEESINNIDGIRMNTALAYVSPALSRSNFHLPAETFVRRILFDGTRARWASRPRPAESASNCGPARSCCARERSSHRIC